MRSSHLSGFGSPVHGIVASVEGLALTWRDGADPAAAGPRCRVWLSQPACPARTSPRVDTGTPAGNTWWFICQERPVCPFEFWVKSRRAVDVENTVELGPEEPD